MSFLQMDLREAFALEFLVRRGDLVATATALELLPAGSECFLCGQGSEADPPRLLVSEDPAAEGTAIVAALCEDCFTLPLLVKLHKTRKLLVAMFPKLNPRKIQFVPPAQIARALRRGAR